MPCTPIAVSAWRTSSSLKGFITATTSFMEVASWRVRSLSCWFYRQYAQKISEICRGGEGYPQIYPLPGGGAAFFALLRRAGTFTNTGVRYGPGSAAHHAVKNGALRCVR